MFFQPSIFRGYVKLWGVFGLIRSCLKQFDGAPQKLPWLRTMVIVFVPYSSGNVGPRLPNGLSLHGFKAMGGDPTYKSWDDPSSRERMSISHQHWEVLKLDIHWWLKQIVLAPTPWWKSNRSPFFVGYGVNRVPPLFLVVVYHHPKGTSPFFLMVGVPTSRETEWLGSSRDTLMPLPEIKSQSA